MSANQWTSFANIYNLGGLEVKDRVTISHQGQQPTISKFKRYYSQIQNETLNYGLGMLRGMWGCMQLVQNQQAQGSLMCYSDASVGLTIGKRVWFVF